GIGLARVGPLGDAHRLDAFGDDSARNILDVLKEALEPALQVEAIPQHEVCGLRLHDVEGCRLVVVDLGTRLGDAFEAGGSARHVLSAIRKDRAGGRDAQGLAPPAASLLSLRAGSNSERQAQEPYHSAQQPLQAVPCTPRWVSATSTGPAQTS